MTRFRLDAVPFAHAQEHCLFLERAGEDLSMPPLALNKAPHTGVSLTQVAQCLCISDSDDVVGGRSHAGALDSLLLGTEILLPARTMRHMGACVGVKDVCVCVWGGGGMHERK